MRKLAKALVALTLCAALLSAAALASPGDAIIGRRDTDAFTDYVRQVAAIGDTLYMLGNEAVYTWRPGDADLTKHVIPDELYSQLSGPDSYTHYYMGMFAWDGEIYLLINITTYDNETYSSSTESICYSRLSFQEDGSCALEYIDDLDWEPMMQYYDESTYAREPETLLVVGDTLFVKTYGDMGIEIYAVPLDGGYAEQVEDVNEPYGIAAYTEDRLLIEEIDYSNGYTVTLKVYDPESEEMDVLYTRSSDDYSTMLGLVADLETGMLYYLGQGMLNSLDLETQEITPVNDFPTSSAYDSSACLLEGGYYACATYEATIVRNTDPALRAEKTLSVCNAAYADVINRIYYDYSNAHGDISLAISTDYSASQSIVEAMMNHSSQYDIYVIQGTESAYNAVYTRGYMAELSGSQVISSFVEEMYPSLAEQLKSDGEIVAVPLEMYGSTFGLNLAAVEKLGLSAEEIPGNWPDFLDWLATLAPRMEEAGVQLAWNWETQSEIRNELFQNIFTDYQKYLNYSGQEQGYNTDLLYTALKKLEEIDLDAFGIPKEIDWDDESPVAYASDEDNPILISSYVSATISDSYSFASNMPLLLSMSADTPAILQLRATYAFVNPYSEHKEEAVSFLETALGSMTYGVKASLVPTMNESTRPSYYEQNKQAVQEEYERIVKELENASAQDREMYEEMERDYARYLEYIENSMWEVSPAAIEWYRSHDDNILFEKYHPLYSGDAGSEIYSLLQQYMDGSIPLEQMLRSIDQKVQMMVLEGN